jgi:hypothetical protein
MVSGFSLSVFINLWLRLESRFGFRLGILSNRYILYWPAIFKNFRFSILADFHSYNLSGTPYEGGIFHLMLKFEPRHYSFKPPRVIGF